jgi:hypothetical protein
LDNSRNAGPEAMVKKPNRRGNPAVEHGSLAGNDSSNDHQLRRQY